MIPRISSSGSSFKGLATYLTRDPGAATTERVAWTHTHNLASDHVPSAVNEMYLTAQNAELLKQEAGIRAGGRSTGNPVKHISLNWSPEEKPTREHMVATAEDYLKKMGWQDHQAVFVAHDDRAHSHVHIMLNVVHPETGLRLDDDFERRRSQTWALQYERDQGRIYCSQRELAVEKREKNPPRNIWKEFQISENQFLKSEIILSEIRTDEPKNPKDAEWKILKEIQRSEREEFFTEGKSEFKELRKSIYREFRDEFRNKWAEYYEARKNGADPRALTETKAQLVGDQKALLDVRREVAFGALRETRDERYRTLLDRQREERAELRWHQEAGLDAMPFLSAIADGQNAARDRAAQFRKAAADLMGRPRKEEFVTGRNAGTHHESPAAGSGRDRGGRFRMGVPSAMRILDGLFTALTGEGPRPPEPIQDAFEIAAEEATKRQQSIEYRTFDHERLARQKALGGD